MTGGIYLFKPQIEGMMYAPYRGVAASGFALPPSRIAAAGTAAAVLGSVLHKYVLPDSPEDAVKLLVGVGAKETRVWVAGCSSAQCCCLRY